MSTLWDHPTVAPALALAARGYQTKRLTLRRTPQRHRRLPNGSVIGRRPSGPGLLGISSSSHSDAVLKLVAGGGRAVVRIYVRARKDASVSGIPLGSFRALVAEGEDDVRGAFNRDCRFTALPDRIAFNSRGLWPLYILSAGLGGVRAIGEREFRAGRLARR